MKKLVAKLFIALVVLGGIPSLSLANTTSLTETVTTNNLTANAGWFRLDGYSYQTHRVYLERGYAQIVLSGDGDTDLDLYVYDGSGLSAKSESYSDDEVINITVNRSGYFIIKVVNRGDVYNDYSLVVE